MNKIYKILRNSPLGTRVAVSNRRNTITVFILSQNFNSFNYVVSSSTDDTTSTEQDSLVIGNRGSKSAQLLSGIGPIIRKSVRNFHSL